MKLVRLRRSNAARGVASVAGLFLLVSTLGIPAGWAQQQATITGVILDPDGKPQPGCQIVIREIGSGTEYRSARTGGDGVYSIDVPVGPRYAFVSVLDPAGGTHPLSLTPLAVTMASKLTRNIRIVPAAGAPSTPAAAPTPVPPPKAAPAPAPAPKAAPAPAPAAPAPAAAPAPQAKAPAAAPKTTTTAKTPPAKESWWKKNGKWVGIGVGAVAIAALAGGGSDSSNPSPSNP